MTTKTDEKTEIETPAEATPPTEAEVKQHLSKAAYEVKDIHEAIVAVMGHVGYVQKTSSPNLRYTYAGEAGLIAALRPWMVHYGIYVNMQDIQIYDRERYTTDKGTMMVNTVMVGKVRFTHAPSGTFIDVPATGEGSDSGDKSCNKAMTGLYKYTLRETFCIETGDDPDKDSSEEMARSQTGAGKTRNAAANATRSAPRPPAPNLPIREIDQKTGEVSVTPASNKELVDYAVSLGIGGGDRSVTKATIGQIFAGLGMAGYDPARWADIKTELAKAAPVKAG